MKETLKSLGIGLLVLLAVRLLWAVFFGGAK